MRLGIFPFTEPIKSLSVLSLRASSHPLILAFYMLANKFFGSKTIDLAYLFSIIACYHFLMPGFAVIMLIWLYG